MIRLRRSRCLSNGTTLVWNEKGTRFYNQKDIEEISKIHLLVKQNKYTIQGAIEKLKMDKKKIDENVKIVQKLKKIRDFLTQLKQEL